MRALIQKAAGSPDLKADFGSGLNISRYVSTAKPEEKIDLNAVHDDLHKIEEKSLKRETSITDFEKVRLAVNFLSSTS